MFLKRLEIIGFKSFAERIGIDFVPGVTAVVGPNGSGKSNITDAIRWVLGEQSAKSLRGAKMEDVIFAGSDSRKPLNFAEVTLILDNSKGLFPLDYTEISVSRRVFRSGESTYLLNGQQCRLLDINNVFMDSGLGKEAFSIISQGRVDEILNSRPEDRRSIFDEAAGVLKYRNRKRKAEHKLFETSDNLDRVLDILKELEIRIAPLKESAEAAEKHATLSEETREADSLLLNYDAGKLRVEIEAKLKEAEKFEVKQQQLKTATGNAEEESRRLKELLATVDHELETLQKKLVDVSSEAEKWEGRRLLSIEKERNATVQIERLQLDLASAREEKSTLQTKLEQSQSKLSSLTAEYKTISTEMNEIAQILKRSVVETENEIEELKSIYIDNLNEEATLRNELKHIEERLAGEKYSSEKIVEQTKSLNKRLKELTDEKSVKERALVNLTAEMKQVSAAFISNTNELRENEVELSKKEQLLQQAYNKQHEMQGRMRALQSMEADFSGFYSGVKEVLVARKSGKLSGINGAVAELINVDNDYVNAVETALGGAMQHIVTTSEADARKAIGYLKSRNAGRATFLPLDVMKSRKIQPTALRSIEHHPEFISTADELVNVPGPYKIITENLLGNVLVSKTLTGASEIAKAVNYRFRVVTLNGDIVNAGGSLTGGGTKGRATIFSRKAELETLQSQLSQMASSIGVAEVSIGDSKMKVAEFMQKTEQSRKSNETLQLEMAAAQSSIRETDIAINALEIERASVEMGRRGAETTGSELATRKIALEENHQQLLKKLETIKKEIETLERLAADRRNEEASLTSRLTELRERAAVMREQTSYEKTAIHDMEQSLESAQQRMTAISKELDYINGVDGEENLTAEEISNQIEQAIAKKEAVETAIIKYRENRLKQTASIVEKEEVLRDLRSNVEKMNIKHNNVTIELSRLEVKYEAITGRLLNEYGLRPDFSATIEFDEQAVREKLIRLKQELADIGPVNPGAINEYKEVSERHEFLTAQRNDLLEAKQTLQVAMSEMDEEMTSRFSSTFDAVQNRFRHVFKEMFGGGNADLILTDPNNLLETGVDIVARPPGKKLQNLSLLSGGERALTAISLLFAIIEVRPVPFCILDEVEAALDEANVIRYSKYLKKFSDKTQFIVITHRKGTMEGADVLYGITMQESGVSKLISVKLSEIPEEAIM
ncbi:chromosome segregation protein SMC [Sporosarcina sp. Marseille-Q4063]|uniref:chromosome segregation protein SMC n=1 Tax=Sporosarcina sp. Marseille-Q4063 TaxID=2810514 RepID=UPI001BB027AF|nr:chromosome segregation protein SMC [Sporosarcina sp. Marseille-Q4063]QUW21847.1 chromosome segregation protein SMC [Sporosarcina sp. Marseille-Q4063]